MRKYYWIGLLGLLLTGNAAAQQNNISEDPYENFNRHIYAFNEGIDKVLIKPLAVTYQTLIPSVVRTHVTNAFRNINLIPTVFNDLLQANTAYLSKDTWRFVINSTVGIGGLFDPAKHLGLTAHYEDFGLTLAKWGYHNSHYLMLPFFGPSTVRDTLGMPVNYAASIYPQMDDTSSYIVHGTEIVNARANLLNYDNVLKLAFDPYAAVRNGYMQRRDSAIDAN